MGDPLYKEFTEEQIKRYKPFSRAVDEFSTENPRLPDPVHV